jgi:hypothetical protein
MDWRGIMTIVSLARLALGAGGALIAAAALAQTQPAPAPAPAASPYAPTATLGSGYPGVGTADAKLRVVTQPNGKALHVLPATLETTQWGWFDNAQAPVLRVKSGDTIALETMMHAHNQVVSGTTIEQIKKTRNDFPGRGPHTLTGPIYIEEAQPGDVLKVTLNKIVPRAYATNFNVPGMFGQFPNVYSDGQVKYLYLDLDKMQTEFLPGIVLPLKPFPGTLGVARKEPGRYSSVPPGEYDIEAWHDSMARIEQWHADTLFLAHFGPAAPSGPHLSVVRERLDLASRIVRASLDREGTDMEREAWFVETARNGKPTMMLNMRIRHSIYLQKMNRINHPNWIN